MTLVSRHLKISIVFEGQAIALQQFSATLMKAFTEGKKALKGKKTDFVPDHEADELVLSRGGDVNDDDDDDDLPISHPVRGLRSLACTLINILYWI